LARAGPDRRVAETAEIAAIRVDADLRFWVFMLFLLFS
jgi:hypothetical protein